MIRDLATAFEDATQGRLAWRPDLATNETEIEIVTADCSNPHEIDDGQRTKEITAGTYRTTVAIADARPIYDNPELSARVLEQRESEYFELRTANEWYVPLFPDDVVRQAELKEGTRRTVLAIEFIVSKDVQPICVADVGFKTADITHNLDYQEFRQQAVPGGRHEADANVARMISQQLFGGVFCAEEHESSMFKNGARTIAQSMLVANYIAGTLFRVTEADAIYRACRADDAQVRGAGHFTNLPLRHNKIPLEQYARVTSPLRRGDDTFNHGAIERYLAGRETTIEEHNFKLALIRGLNLAVMARGLDISFDESLEQSPDELLVT